MADTPLIKRLGIKPNRRLLILNAPGDYLAKLAPLPDGTTLAQLPEGTFDFVHLFVQNKAELNRLAPVAIQALEPGGILWISYPKRISRVPTDLTRDEVWTTIFAAVFEAVAQVAIDDIWSASRFRP